MNALVEMDGEEQSVINVLLNTTRPTTVELAPRVSLVHSPSAWVLAIFPTTALETLFQFLVILQTVVSANAATRGLDQNVTSAPQLFEKELTVLSVLLATLALPTALAPAPLHSTVPIMLQPSLESRVGTPPANVLVLVLGTLKIAVSAQSNTTPT